MFIMSFGREEIIALLWTYPSSCFHIAHIMELGEYEIRALCKCFEVSMSSISAHSLFVCSEMAISVLNATLYLSFHERMFSFWPWRWYEVSTFPLHEIFGSLFLWETILGLLVASWLQFADHCQWCSFDLVCWLLADLVWCSCWSFAQNSVNNNISKIQLINWRREERK